MENGPPDLSSSAHERMEIYTEHAGSKNLSDYLHIDARWTGVDTVVNFHTMITRCTGTIGTPMRSPEQAIAHCKAEILKTVIAAQDAPQVPQPRWGIVESTQENPRRQEPRHTHARIFAA